LGVLLQKFGTPEAKNLVNKSLQDFNKQTLAEANIDGSVAKNI
jgi:hypothetical protein